MGFVAWRIRENQEIDGVPQRVGEIRFMGVVPDRQGEGIGHQLLANALQIMWNEHGSDDLIIRIDHDTDNAVAGQAYEAWGFEYYRTFESNGAEYNTLLLRPPAEGGD